MEQPLKIPTKSLPKGWKQKGAEQFEISESMVEKIVWGVNKNAEVFAYMLELAEVEKQRVEKEEELFKNRLAALTK